MHLATAAHLWAVGRSVTVTRRGRSAEPGVARTRSPKGTWCFKWSGKGRCGSAIHAFSKHTEGGPGRGAP